MNPPLSDGRGTPWDTGFCRIVRIDGLLGRLEGVVLELARVLVRVVVIFCSVLTLEASSSCILACCCALVMVDGSHGIACSCRAGWGCVEKMRDDLGTFGQDRARHVSLPGACATSFFCATVASVKSEV